MRQGLRFGGAINGGLRRRPLGVSAIGGEGVGRGMASWTPGSQRYGAVVVGEPCYCCCRCLPALFVLWCLRVLLFYGVCCFLLLLFDESFSVVSLVVFFMLLLRMLVVFMCMYAYVCVG